LLGVGLGSSLSFFAAGNAHAIPVSYVINSGTSATLNGSVETITGSFTFDAATFTESLVSITATGPSPFAGTYTDNALDISQLQGDGANNIVCGSVGGETLCLNFLNPLSGGAASLHFVGFGTTPNSSPTAYDSTPTGSASPGTPGAAPVPAALPLFATGLGLMGFLAKRRKRKPAAQTAA
jgi:hypothetical protein